MENYLPAAALIASASRLRPAILHSHAYEKAPSGALKHATRDFEVRRISGLAFVSEDCANRFRLNFPNARAPMRAVPNGLDMADWSDSTPKDKTILSVGRALDDKGHVEAMAAIVRLLSSRPEWNARLILSAIDREPRVVRELREAADPFDGRIRIDTNLPYGEVKAAWEKAAVGMALTKTPEPFGQRRWRLSRADGACGVGARRPCGGLRRRRAHCRSQGRGRRRQPALRPYSIHGIFAPSWPAQGAPASRGSSTSAWSPSGWMTSSTSC